MYVYNSDIWYVNCMWSSKLLTCWTWRVCSVCVNGVWLNWNKRVHWHYMCAQCAFVQLNYSLGPQRAQEFLISLEQAVWQECICVSWLFKCVCELKVKRGIDNTCALNGLDTASSWPFYHGNGPTTQEEGSQIWSSAEMRNCDLWAVLI